MIKNKNKYLKLILVFIGSLLITLLDKFLSRNIIVYNEGISFGFGNSEFSLIASIISFSLLTFLFLKTENKLQGASLFLISVGGFSNVIDRIESGSVADYWKFFDLWYFNLADVLIVIGTIVFISTFLIENEKGN